MKRLRSLLLLLGRPFLYVVFFAIFTVIAVIALLSRSSVYSIKLFTKGLPRLLNLMSGNVYRLRNILHRRGKKSVNLLTSHPRQASRVARFSKIRLKGALLIGIMLMGTVMTFAVSYTYIINDLPNPNRLSTRDQIVTTKILDRNGKVLFKIFKNENRTPVDLNDIPLQVRQATIAIEDKDFYSHSGFSYSGMMRAIRRTVFEGHLEGGSTITQQLVKNALLTKEQTLRRKLKEIILAILVESRYSKDEILGMYFNEVGYGGATYGVEEAAQMYFHKSVQDLNLSEAALIAGLPAAPTRYSPFGTHPEYAKFRQHEVLRRMVEDGYITPDQAEQAKTDELAFAPQTIDIKAPHFVMYVKDLLVQKYGEQMVEQGGLEVVTSLDLDVQSLAQAAVVQEVDRLQKLNITNGASLVTIPATGEILAMVGSRDFLDFKHDGQVNVTLQPRQPGSAIKPVNYAVALENGFTASTLLTDSPITYQIPGQPPYTPRNYDGEFHGTISVREALANSYNVPAVKTLSVFGVEKMVQKGQEMGISTWGEPSRFGLSLTLGGGEIKMTDLAVVYGALANGGFRVDLNPILMVSDYRGRLLYQYSCDTETDWEIAKNFAGREETGRKTCNPRQVVKPEVAFILTDIMADNQARTPAFGAHSALSIGNQQVAVKTGTTQNLRDNWTIGYTQDRLVASWVGNNDNSPMSYVASGLTGASPIWNNIMSALLANVPSHQFMPPETIKQMTICPSTGTLPCESCSGRPEYFMQGTEPTRACLPEVAGEAPSPQDVSVESLKSQARNTIRNTSFESIVNERLVLQ